MKKIIIILYVVCRTFSAGAQNEIDSAKHELERINQVFDSSRYLSFNLDISYQSDSVTKIEPVESDFVSGRYVLNNENVYFEMGDMIYAQTDSFTYSIYTDEQMMIMIKNSPMPNSNYFPVKNFLDSVWDINDYNIQIDSLPLPDSLDEDSPDHNMVILFTKKVGASDAAKYEFVKIEYDTEGYYPYLFEFAYKDVHFTQEKEDSAMAYQVTRRMTMRFKNYRPVVSTELFDDNQYVLYNRQRRIYEPIERYKTYQFLTSGFDNTDPEEELYMEVPYEQN